MYDFPRADNLFGSMLQVASYIIFREENGARRGGGGGEVMGKNWGDAFSMHRCKASVIDDIILCESLHHFAHRLSCRSPLLFVPGERSSYHVPFCDASLPLFAIFLLPKSWVSARRALASLVMEVQCALYISIAPPARPRPPAKDFFSELLSAEALKIMHSSERDYLVSGRSCHPARSSAPQRWHSSARALNFVNYLLESSAALHYVIMNAGAIKMKELIDGAHRTCQRKVDTSKRTANNRIATNRLCSAAWTLCMRSMQLLHLLTFAFTCLSARAWLGYVSCVNGAEDGVRTVGKICVRTKAQICSSHKNALHA